MKKRKWICFLAAFVMIVSSVFEVGAVEATIYSETDYATAGSELVCPIRIRDNPGLMGFKLTITYEENVLTPVSVQNGEVTQSGMLNDSVGLSSPGSFEVIWSYSANVTSNGVLMTLVFRTAETVPESTKIGIKVSQPDTFNDAWEDVPLRCEPIQIFFSADAQQSSGVTPGEVTRDAVLYAVDSVLQEQDVSSISEVPEGKQDAFLQSVNQDIQNATGNADYFSGIQAMSDAYTRAAKEAYLANAQQQVDGDKILLSVEQALEETGASAIDEVPEDKQTAFVQSVEEKLAQYMSDAPELSSRVDMETAMDTLQELQKRVAQDVDDSTPAPVEDYVVNHALVIGFCIAGAAILAAVIAAAIYIKKKKSKNKEEMNKA